ncbi:hypothetical protein [Halomonas maura]|uniref:hypothetical protein n=1 Tax=Halomonas maura TaxID=117606 RepID=UPI0025B44462|nr:hypothetical protein [Halomonas maura]MDN3555232.1 hypothetical protein [Halomonas maura]
MKTIERHVNKDVAEIIDVLQNDQNIPLFMDREYPQTLKSRFRYLRKREHSPRSLLNYWALCYSWILEAYTEVVENKPPYLFCPSTPHLAKWYIRAKVYELMGVPVYIVHQTRLKEYFKILKGTSRNAEVVKISGNENNCYVQDARQYINRCKTNYADAMPGHDKKRLENNNGKYLNVGMLCQRNLARPDFVINTIRCWKELKKLSISINDINAKGVAVYYLHYQPERTTLPEACGFTQQLRAILYMRALLPKDILLLVKEHPATFIRSCSPRARDPMYYKYIASIEGVELIDIHCDTFELIDNSVLTATICGTVNTESLIRGKPTVIFGVDKFPEVTGQHVYESKDKLNVFIEDAVSGLYKKEDVSSDVEKAIYMEGEYVYSLKGEVNSGLKHMKARVALEDFLLSSHCHNALA